LIQRPARAAGSLSALDETATARRRRRPENATSVEGAASPAAGGAQRRPDLVD
jgi:hypothetical protein